MCFVCGHTLRSGICSCKISACGSLRTALGMTVTVERKSGTSSNVAKEKPCGYLSCMDYVWRVFGTTARCLALQRACALSEHTHH